MRKLSVFAFVLMFCLTGYAQFEDYVDEHHGQDKKRGPSLVLKTNPFAILSGDIPLFTSEYRGIIEYVPDYKSSITGGVSLLTMSPILKATLNQDTALSGSGYSADNFALLGYRLQVGYRIYPQGLLNKSVIDGTFPPKGFFLFGLISYSDGRLFLRQNRGDQIQFSHASVTGNVGYQFVVDETITFELYLGGGYKNNQIIERSRNSARSITNQPINDSFIYNNNLKINFGLNFGLIF